MTKYMQEWRTKNADRIKKLSREYYLKNRNSILEKNRKWRASHPEKVRARHIRYYATHKKEYYEKSRTCNLKRIGVTPEFVDQRIKELGGKCEICHRVRKLHVDHNHKTGKFRGILCFSCNAGLGNVQDKIYILEWMIEYLEKHGTAY